MQSLLLDKPSEQRSDAKLSGTTRKDVIQAESVTYVRMIAAFQKVSLGKLDSRSSRGLQVIENTIDTRAAISATDQSRPH